MLVKYGKSIVAFLFVVYGIVVPLVSGDHHIDPDEGLIIVLAILNNVVVYLFPLVPQFKTGKSIVMGLTAAAVVAQTVIANGLDLNDWYLIVGAFLTAIFGTLAPAVSTVLPNPVGVGWGSDN